MESNRQDHWDRIYAEKSETDVSWFQDNPAPSLELLRRTGCPKDAGIIDIGGGASRVVDRLVSDGYGDVSVLDIAEGALDKAKRRLGADAGRVAWTVADIILWRPERTYDVWHDRAVFHFLTDKSDRAAYRRAMRAATKPGATAIIATFAPDGPERCSGLPIVRYSPRSLADELGDGVTLIDSLIDAHRTPSGGIQHFQFSRFAVD